MSKVVSTSDAIKHIKNGSTICTGGFVGLCHPEALTSEIEKSFISRGEPKNLTVVYAAGQGDGKEKGINHLAHEGLVKRVIGGHWALAPKMAKLAVENKIEAYNFPQGVISHLYRDIAAKKPGTITHVGLDTFVDPRISGGMLNKKTTEKLVDIIKLDGSEWLFYKAFRIDVALIKGTSADVDGNISMEKEAGLIEVLSMAQAARNSGGIVIAQVERIVAKGSLNPWMVKVPGILVDYIVIAGEEDHWQTFAEKYNPSFSGEIKIPLDFIPKLSLNERKIICRRALAEIKENMVVNLGIGLPEGISMVANEEGILDLMKLSVECGVIGGIPANGLSFGASYNPDCIIDQPAQFDFYDGGGLDITFLGMAQTDKQGNVNVSKFGHKIAGCGGFIDISQNTKKVVFCGTFTSGGLEISIDKAKLKIIKEGTHKKFIESVEQITFSGSYAFKNKQVVLYITERAVFELKDSRVVLTEIAPGMDIKKDIFSQMAFEPVISKQLKPMDEGIFR